MAHFKTLDAADVKGKRVLVRVDLNVPMENGKVSDATRLERIAPGLRDLAARGAKVILLAHFGRPKGRDPKDSLKPVADALARVLGRKVAFAQDCVGPAAEQAVAAMQPGDVLCLENTRFHKEGAQAPRLCRGHHAGGAGGAGQGAGEPAAAGGGDRRRRQGLHQARAAR